MLTSPKACIFKGFKDIKNGSKGARTLGLPLVRRALIPAELCFHEPIISFYRKKSSLSEVRDDFFYSGHTFW